MLLALILATAPAEGQQPPPELSAEALIDAARAALAKGEPEDAAFLLDGVKPGEGNPDDLDFLRGSIAMQRGEWQKAMARFRAMLARNPDLPRVRLALIFRRRMTAMRPVTSAWRWARRTCPRRCAPRRSPSSPASGGASDGRLPARWRLCLVPDTNINARTDAREILLGRRPGTL